MTRLKVKVAVASGAVTRLKTALMNVEKKAARGAMRAGINEITKTVAGDAKGLAARRSGQLKRAIGRKVKTYRQTIVVGIVGPRRGFKVSIAGVPVDPTRYAHLVEFGRAAVRAGSKSTAVRGGRITTQTGKTILTNLATAVAPDPKRVFGPAVAAASPEPFMRPAWDANRRSASRVLARHLSAALAKAAGQGAVFAASLGTAGTGGDGD